MLSRMTDDLALQPEPTSNPGSPAPQPGLQRYRHGEEGPLDGLVAADASANPLCAGEAFDPQSGTAWGDNSRGVQSADTRGRDSFAGAGRLAGDNGGNVEPPFAVSFDDEDSVGDASSDCLGKSLSVSGNPSGPTAPGGLVRTATIVRNAPLTQKGPWPSLRAKAEHLHRVARRLSDPGLRARMLRRAELVEAAALAAQQ